MLHQLKITFYLYTYRTNSRGEAPVFCKIVFRTNRKQFSTGVFTNPDKWDRESQRVKGSDDLAHLVNRKLQEIYSQFIRIEKQLYDEGMEVSLNTIYGRYKGKIIERTLCGVFEERLSKMEALAGSEYTEATIQKFREVYAHAKQFLIDEHKQDDIILKHLNYGFIKQYEEYLLAKKLKPITINKIIQRLRQMITFAVRCGYIDRDPFVEYKPLKEKKQLVFLTEEELTKLEKYRFRQFRLEQVKDLYLFSVYTGLAYNEAYSLQAKHITKGFDGRNWITITRRKTDKDVAIPLLPQAEAILKRFGLAEKDYEGYLLPRISNQKINSYLKEIAEIVGIDKKMTHHTARKTFASTILLYNDVPIEVVSMLLGHSDISVTQRSYAQVVNRNVSNHMNRLEEKLK